MEDKKVKDSINVEAVQKRIETLKYTIQMLTKTLGEMILSETAPQESIEIVKHSINGNRQELSELRQLLKDEEERNFPKFVSSEYWNPKKQDGVVGTICGHEIYEPVMERNFIIEFPDFLGIDSSDVISYNEIGDSLHIKICNNVRCPILSIQKAIIDKSFTNETKAQITIVTLDTFGDPLYKTIYYISSLDTYQTTGGNYNSNEPQRILLKFIINYKLHGPANKSQHKDIKKN